MLEPASAFVRAGSSDSKISVARGNMQYSLYPVLLDTTSNVSARGSSGLSSTSSYLVAPEELVVVDIFDPEIGREELQYTVSSHILAAFTGTLPAVRLPHG